MYYSALHQAQTENNYDKLLAFFENEQEKFYQNVKEYIIPLTQAKNTDNFINEYVKAHPPYHSTENLGVNVADILKTVESEAQSDANAE